MSVYHPVDEARRAALDVLRHNAHGPYLDLPRTAGWGYPEPYTRDLMIASFGILVSQDEMLIDSLRRVLETLAHHQSTHGHIPGLVHDPQDRGSSDTTLLFLIGLGLFREATGDRDFLDEAAQKALTWMRYQSPDDSGLVAQQPTSDWRDEQWVLGYGLYVNVLNSMALQLFHREQEAATVRALINRPAVQSERKDPHLHEGFVLQDKPYYALWTYKVHQSQRFDLLGNVLAILSGVTPADRAQAIVAWLETTCDELRASGDLALDLPPCLFPYIQPGDLDWHPRYALYNLPGEYHNGGIWPFIAGFYIAALVAVRQHKLARERLGALADLVSSAKDHPVAFGINEWFRAQDGQPRGQDWQTWSAAMYLYAASVVEQGKPLLMRTT